MKAPVIVFLLLLFNLCALGQTQTTDRLKQRLTRERTDSSLARSYDSLSMYYLFFTNKPDSSFRYINAFIDFAFPLEDKKYLILAYARLGFYYFNADQFKDAIQFTLKGIALSEDQQTSDYLSTLYYNLAWIYFNLGDKNQSLENAFKGISFLKYSKDSFFDQSLHLHGITANIYVSINKFDSALFYFKKMDSIQSRSKELFSQDVSGYFWANYYLYKEDYSHADSILNIAIASCKRSGDFLLNNFLLYASQSSLGQGKARKAIGYGYQAYMVSLDESDRNDAYLSASLLNTCYEKIGNQDSAYRYLKISDSLRDVDLAFNNANEIQQIRFDNELDRKEKTAAEILQKQKNTNKITEYVFFASLFFFGIVAAVQWRNNQHRKRSNILLQKQKEKVENALQDLKAAQIQLIQSEKMASLGELTAGIAHEIQNPLNFVNNFSDVNTELIEEVAEEIDKGNINDAKKILNDIKENEEKINHHGKRADAIVKGMLQHSRSSTGVKEPVNINAIADECLRLSYHSIRSKDKSFQADLKTDFDDTIDKIPLVQQEIVRVLVNLFNNAFYAVNEKIKQNIEGYEPTVTVSTKKINDKVVLTVMDNGNGIPEKVVDKIFQPFFTTKPTGQGTGLGLSLSYDIIKAHGGELKVETKEGEYAEFIVQLPISA